MKSTLRDENLRNLSISEKMLNEINFLLLNIINTENNLQTDQNGKLWINYIIRYDKKGRSLLEFKEATDCYKNARKIERFLFSVQCLQSYRDKMFGKSIEIRFDAIDTNNSRLIVQGDDNAWVESTYASLAEIIKKYKNFNGIIRSFATPFLIQILGVFIGVLLSIKGAQLLAPKLQIEYPFPFAFLFVFLLFSNIWTYLYAGIIQGINFLWPNIIFKEKTRAFMVIKWIINVILSAIFLAGVKSVFSFMYSVLSGILK
jgi:hypothetical protein